MYNAYTAEYKAAQAAKLDIATDVYNYQTIEFWAKNDVEGQSAIKLANDIRKRWKDDEKNSATEGEAAIKKKDEEKSSVTEGEAAIKMDQSSSADSDASYQKMGL